jgi:hypothetical protein
MTQTKTGILIFHESKHDLLNNQFVTYQGDYPTLEDIRHTDRFERACTVLSVTHDCKVWVLKHPDKEVPFQLK